jgi:putative hydrolase of the HAD superfamily
MTFMEQAVFFDLDDTLITHDVAIRAAARELFSTVVGSYETGRFAFEERWIQLNRLWYQRFFAGEITFQYHSRGKLREALTPWNVLLSDAQADSLLHSYWQTYVDGCRLYEDVLPCFAQLSTWRIGIVTNGEEAQQRRKIAQCGLLEHIDLLVTSERVGVPKPAPTIFLTACEQIGLTASACVFVGDHIELDVVGSRQAGLRGIWLDRDRSDHRYAGETIHDLRELLGLFRG